VSIHTSELLLGARARARVRRLEQQSTEDSKHPRLKVSDLYKRESQDAALSDEEIIPAQHHHHGGDESKEEQQTKSKSKHKKTSKQFFHETSECLVVT
jgi:hypothetical protein